jgi:hypothetical protein
MISGISLEAWRRWIVGRKRNISLRNRRKSEKKKEDAKKIKMRNQVPAKQSAGTKLKSKGRAVS